MKRFECQCGNTVFFENSVCGSCNQPLGFDPDALTIHSLVAIAENEYQSQNSGEQFRYCSNHHQYGVCNWLISDRELNSRCKGCGMNRTIPDLGYQINVSRWRELEKAKKRLLYTLYTLGLPVNAPDQFRLIFDFVECSKRDPEYDHSPLLTGHLNGVITIDVIEADNVHLENTRQELNEAYRTLLGHFRHEIGHYYWPALVTRANSQMEFRNLFGDEHRPYQQALDLYYETGPVRRWEDQYISAYAASHPLEDWAESFAHYLHIRDSLETASEYNLIRTRPQDNFEQALQVWIQLGIAGNELNRSMGLPDLYPFVVQPAVRKKLVFIDRMVRQSCCANTV